MACPRRWLLASSTACSALVLAGCGGAGETTTTAARPAPLLPASIGADLARDAELVVERAQAGDDPGAKSAAEALQQAAEEAIASGRVPRALSSPLRAAVADLVASIQVPEPPQTTETTKEEPPKHDEKKQGGKKEGKKKHD